MADGGGAPTDFSLDAGGGGAFLLNLLQRQQSQSSSSLLPTQPQPTNSRHVDPAVAVMGPTHTMPYNLFPPPPPVDSATVLSSSPSLPFHSSSSQLFLHHGNNDQQQFAPPLNYRQSFNLPDLGPNQGYQVGGINGGIKEDYNNSANLMAYDEFQRRNQQQFVPPMNLNINISTMARDFSSNQGYPVGDNGGMRDMYNANHNMRDISQSTNQQYISLLNRHQRPDHSANLGLPNGYNENLTRNQRIQDAQKLFDLISQREREERIFQRPIHPSQQINQFPNLNNYDGINYPNRGNLNGNDNYNPNQFLNSHNSRDLGKWVNPNEKENTVTLDKFEIFSKKSETGFVNSNQNNASFVASSSDTSKEEEREEDLLAEQLTESLVLDDKNALVPSKKFIRNKEYRCDFRGQNVSSQRIRIQRRTIQCRRDIDVFAPAFLTIYESLIPSNEEVTKQRNLISSLNKVIRTEWPHARLHIYGSCASNFAVSNSDIDLCLKIDTDLEKPEIIVKLAEILEHAKLEIMQALPRARVPIVKMMDPETGISCDICINNLLAVVNTKLLKDYSIIDPRLRQLAYLVKHWAKSRRVNETYQGTLSSYSYVIMCIYYLQNRRPAILPSLQSMEATYVAKIDDKEYVYYDKVENLRGLGARNRESISRLIWGFFQYWAYQHDYTSDVISIRTGSVISKHEKDWTRRVGNDRHLICIEDPFETTHDLGRVVDKFTIKILREEFERAANIMQYDPNPTVGLFEKYIPPPKVEEDFGDEFEGLNIH